MKTAIYLRQSLDRDENKLAVDRQRTACMKLCKDKGWTDTVEYVDNNKSATSGRRPGYQQMLADIRSGAVEAVVAYDSDRLQRQPIELEEFITLCTEKHNVKLATVGGDFDLSTEAGQYYARLEAARAKREVQRKSARQKVANRQRAESGKAWQQRTFGYDGDTIVPAEAEAIRKATHAILNGATLWSIAKEWNTAGLTTAKGFQWEGAKVRALLMRPSLAGLVTHDVKAARAEARRHGQPVYLAGVIDGAQGSWKPILDRDTWEAVCKLLSDPKRFTGRSMGRKHLLSGIAWCGECGRHMGTTIRAARGGTKRVVYQCKNIGCMKIVRDLGRTDELVVGVITERLADPDAARKLAKPTVDTKALTQKIGTYRKLIEATREEYNEGLIDARDRNARIERLTAKVSPLEDKLLGSHMSRDVKDLAGKPDAADRFGALPLDRRRGVIDTLVEVTINRQRKGGRFDPESVDIVWK
ncbi:recombinase family protein [Mycolicibacterium sp. D5.8-2]|jgi:DNA invertase Pin-like site-specific DNA recombinase|uniref:recombinase family protein n=1 Tax=Mycolicibacterium sp. D5.8-2 TaxID=3085903 RepID=UPI00298C4727|nr:recombinase family protein [Mycolicibacterium sp. D5.8-2]MDW5610014.1 recombinase family protein [Mycolicibacterium sp. D5.8-2]